MSDSDVAMTIDLALSVGSEVSLPDWESESDPEHVDLPGDVVSEEDDSDVSVDDESVSLPSLGVSVKVPTPEAVVHMPRKVTHAVAEYYSPPRVCGRAREKGLTGNLSLDILTGWDFQIPWVRSLSLQLLSWFNIVFVMLSPPCTIFSELQKLWNIKRMEEETFNMKWAEHMVYLTHSMDVAKTQLTSARNFGFEHPSTASSWKTAEVKELHDNPHVLCVVFDQCTLGLTSPSGLPIRKRTRIMTNCKMLVDAFAPYRCDRSHTHQRVQGIDKGIKVSRWAQIYPPPMVELLLTCAAKMQQ